MSKNTANTQHVQKSQKPHHKLDLPLLESEDTDKERLPKLGKGISTAICDLGVSLKAYSVLLFTPDPGLESPIESRDFGLGEKDSPRETGLMSAKL